MPTWGVVVDRSELSANPQATDHAHLARPLSLGLMLASPAVLIGGNHAVPELPGRDFTPFDLAGPFFLLALLPAFAVLAYRRVWRGALAAVGLYHLGLIFLTFRWVGGAAALAILAVDVAVVSVVLVADRSERG
jgi:hypothetical protein